MTKSNYHNESGFTLVEMLIVLLVISVLIILIIPNLVSKTGNIQSKGCDALSAVVEAQVNAYQLDKGKLPESIDILVTTNYLKEDQTVCPNKDKLQVINGEVSIKRGAK